MIHIYLCDDEDVIRDQIRTEIEKKIMIEAYDMKVVCSTGRPEALLQAVSQAGQKQNLYMLDVELKDAEYDGFLLGKELRRLDPHGTLVYITSFQNLAFRTFQYHLEAFDYIIKDPKKQRDSISRCLESLHVRLQQETKADVGEVYAVKIGDMVKYVPLKEILCFETTAKSHHVILHTKNSRMEFVGNLNEIGAQMGDAFLRTHRSYLVALDKITEVDLKHNTLKAGNVECLVSRKMKSELLSRM
ncbi:MAG: LytTR family DNA-binding domain-containing protein [Eubacterium sp.]|nr:LytTR family DNA-binding domain-containing protein [Eubacterium sp.]